VRSLTVFVFLALAAQVAPGGDGEPIPATIFGKLPEFGSPMLAPGGQHYAVTMSANGRRVIVVRQRVKPGASETEGPVLIGSGDNYFSWYDWANDNRLVINVRSTTSYFGGQLSNLSRMGSVGRDGKNPIYFEMEPNIHGIYRQHVSVVEWLESDPDHILAVLDNEEREWAAPVVHKVNVNNGNRTLVARNRRGVQHWIADKKGRVRIGIKVDTKFDRQNVTVYYRDADESDWETLQKVDYFDHDRLVPYRFHEADSDVLLVTSANLDDVEDDEDMEEDLFIYDLNVRKVVGPYVDTQRKSVIAAVEKGLPGRKARIVSRDRGKKLYFFRVYSDVDPPEYFLLDLNEMRLDIVASAYPELSDKIFSPMEKVTYDASDGHEIPAFLTVPVGAGRENLPVVVYPHGGPWSHDVWGFDNYVQFMASRGYVVFQPQFRGSTGYGIEHKEAGYGQWGYRIQDDITDGVKWLIEEGIADPERICIVGSSFGGYAAAMGVAKDPELYRCGITVNGVLDLKQLLDSGRYLLYENINQAVWNSREDAQNASPYHLAARIQAPMLIIGSERDTVVPVKHSKRMYKKLKKLKKDVTYIELEDGEHWRTIEALEIQKLQAIEQFLAKHIGN
jgi:dipeptidyl aminopeptidase/acylaminoacyl peptidase